MTIIQEPKYFQEAGGGHYDDRHFCGSVDPRVRREILLELSKAFSRMCGAAGIKLVLMHGGLLGWFWSGKPFPWDDDLDFSIALEDLQRLAGASEEARGYDEVRYLFDVNPCHTTRTSANRHWSECRENNKIDARFIHRATGLFIDVTALSREGGFLVTKCPHRYPEDMVLPLAETDFCGSRLYVPAKPQAVLEQEYGRRALTEPTFRDWVFDSQLRDWTKCKPDKSQKPPKPWDYVAPGPLLNLRAGATAFRRQRKPMGPIQGIYSEDIDVEVEAIPEHSGDLRSWLAKCCESRIEEWWIDLSETIRMGRHGADLFLDHSYDEADVVVCGSFFIRLTESASSWAHLKGVTGWLPDMLLKVPKLEGPATLWRADFGRHFLDAWDNSPEEIRPELLMRAMMERGEASVRETDAGRMGWRVR